MARHISEEKLLPILEAVQAHPAGATASQVSNALESPPPRRTLQYRLRSLVEAGRLVMEGTGRWARYRVPRIVDMQMQFPATARVQWSLGLSVVPPLTDAGIEVRNHVRQPREVRVPIGYNREFLDSYRPNETFYLSEDQRAQLRETGTAVADEQPAGTFAMKVLNRLLIDLSWNSSRLEGNTYSLLDTARLIELDEEAEEKDRLEAQMILNHKDAIEFLVNSAEDVGFNRYTVLNLHGLLADNLLPDPAAAGRLRRIAVRIAGSVFIPLEVPQLVEECFDQVLATASAINDPFEQGLFVLVHLPYLQPFEDVNKRVSRIAANMPLIKHNLSPLSFDDVPTDVYTEAVLGVYEMNRTELLRDVFCWAYARSAARYAAVRQSLGEPDPFRMRHRAALRELVAAVVRERMNKKEAALRVTAWALDRIAEEDRQRFSELAERELLALHEGNFARYGVRPSQFAAWMERWNP